MRYALLVTVAILLAATAYGKIYKWVDATGPIHLKEKNHNEDDKEVEIKATGIKLHETEDNASKQAITDKSTVQSPKKPSLAPKTSKKDPEEEKVISEADYKISANVGELGADIISISGRISSGPKCDNMIVTATAKSDTGMSATITDHIRKSNSFGSVVFQGNAKASGSADDYGFWKIDSVSISCND